MLVAFQSTCLLHLNRKFKISNLCFKKEEEYLVREMVSPWICSQVDTWHGGMGNGKFRVKTGRTVRTAIRSWLGVKIFQNVRPVSEMLMKVTRGSGVFSSRELQEFCDFHDSTTQVLGSEDVDCLCNVPDSRTVLKNQKCDTFRYVMQSDTWSGRIQSNPDFIDADNLRPGRLCLPQSKSSGTESRVSGVYLWFLIRLTFETRDNSTWTRWDLSSKMCRRI